MIYAAYYRLLIFMVPPKYLKPKWGLEGEESAEKEVIEIYCYAKKVSYAVNRICNKTAWESKCLVRALTAKKLLKMKGILSTMYLGCNVEDGNMTAHAWLRCGEMYVTGGDGKGYAIVDKFCS